MNEIKPDIFVLFDELSSLFDKLDMPNLINRLKNVCFSSILPRTKFEDFLKS